MSGREARTLDEHREEGRGIRGTLFGPGADQLQATMAAAKLAPELDRLSDEFVFGQVWTHPGLELPQRSLVTISALVALGRERELRGHIAGGLRAGLAREEIVQAIVHLAFYAGLPACHTALEIAREVFTAFDAADAEGEASPTTGGSR
jgi:4-carboxymuconolactone decarboxylase